MLLWAGINVRVQVRTEVMVGVRIRAMVWVSVNTGWEGGRGWIGVKVKLMVRAWSMTVVKAGTLACSV